MAQWLGGRAPAALMGRGAVSRRNGTIPSSEESWPAFPLQYSPSVYPSMLFRETLTSSPAKQSLSEAPQLQHHLQGEIWPKRLICAVSCCHH